MSIQTQNFEIKGNDMAKILKDQQCTKHKQIEQHLTQQKLRLISYVPEE